MNVEAAECKVPLGDAKVSLWPELFWGLEWLRLRRSPLYRGEGIVRGRGGSVLLIPGFLATDRSLDELRGWLNRIGYRARASGIARNSECPDVLLEDIERRVEAVSSRDGERVSLIGHSLGGTLARAVAIHRPDLVAQVITLGSPIRELKAHALVMGVARLMERLIPSPSQSPRRHGDHVHNGTCSCELADTLARPLPQDVARASIFSRSDGVVDWRSSVDNDGGGLNIEVQATHIGLLANVGVYEAVGALLASLDREAPSVRRELDLSGAEHQRHQR